MIKILLVEDAEEKRRKISEIVAQDPDRWHLETAVDVKDAKQKLEGQRYDIMLLDINLPLGPDKAPNATGGLEVLRWLRERGRAHRPNYIVGTTAYEESFLKAEKEFDNFLWRIVQINVAANEWKGQLKQTLEDLYEQIVPPYPSDGKTYKTDVLVVCALAEPELSEILRLSRDFERVTVAHDSSSYHRARFKRGRKFFDVVAVAASDKGLAGAAIAATKGITAFWPRFVFMPGITAGVQGRTNIGDVIFADPTWDWGSGKIKEIDGEEQFAPAPYQRRLDETLAQRAKELNKTDLMDKAWRSTNYARPKEVPEIRVGAMSSGGSVLQSSPAVQRVIDQHKDLLAIEMEAFSVMFAAQVSPAPRPLPVVAKSVCDNGDKSKSDEFQAFCAEVSAKVFLEFAFENFCREREDEISEDAE